MDGLGEAGEVATEEAAEEDVGGDPWALGDEQFHTDRWLVYEALAVGRSRTLALEPRFAARNALPYAAVAAHILRDGIKPEKPLGGQLAAPMPLQLCKRIRSMVFD